MFGTIRRHQKWLLLIVGTITIVSFLIFYPGSKMGDGGSGMRDEGDYGSINGRKITSREYNNAFAEFSIVYFMSNQQWPDPKSAGVEREVYIRLLLIEKQKELGIEISPRAAGAYAGRAFGLDKASYNAFLEGRLKPAGLTAADFERYLCHQAGIEQMFNVAGLSGKLATPAQLEEYYRNQHEDVHVSLAYFPASRFMPLVPTSDDALAQFYTNAQARYRINERVEVSHVKFNITNYLAAAETNYTNLNKDVEDNIRALGTNLFRDAKTSAESRTRLREELIREKAMVDARKVANAFAVELDNRPKRPEELEKLAAEKKLTVHTNAPFDRLNGPKDLEVPPGFARDAFSLTPEEPFSGGIPARDGVYVLALLRKLPEEIPSFDSISVKVGTDYMESRSLELTVDAAMNFASAVTNGIAQGKTFAQVCATTNITPESLPPFSLATNSLPEEFRERVDFYPAKAAAFSTPVRSPSRPFLSRDRKGVFVLFVEKRTPVAEEKLKQELPRYITAIREKRRDLVFNGWLSAHLAQDPEFARKFAQVTADSEQKAARLPPGL